MEYTMSLIIFSIILFFIIRWLLFFHPKPNQSKLPPGPKPWPIVGNIHQLGQNPHQSVTKLSTIYGPLMSLRLGNLTTIVISSPEIAKQMFLNHDLAFASRHVMESTRVENHDQHSIVFLPVCPKWRNFRKIITTHMFTTKKLDNSQDLRQYKVDELVDYAKSCCEKGLPIDMGKAAFTTTLNLLSNTFFSIDLSSHDSSDSGDFRALVWHVLEESGRPNVSDFFPLLRYLDLQGVMRRMKTSFLQMLGVFNKIIEERLRDYYMSSEDDVLGALLMLVKQQELSLQDIQHLLIDMFIAGSDTTSSTIEWAMTELLRHPDKMTKAQLEIDQITGKDGKVQKSHIAKFSYIQAIVKETLRLHPPVPFLIPHKAEQEVHLCDYTVPKHAQVWVNVWSIGRNPRVWSNPKAFIPERFLGTDIDMKGRDFELIPFGAGRRMCPGMPLANRMVHLMLATLLHSFNWKLPNDMNPEDIDVEEKFGLTLQKKQPLQVIPQTRYIGHLHSNHI